MNVSTSLKRFFSRMQKSTSYQVVRMQCTGIPLLNYKNKDIDAIRRENKIKALQTDLFAKNVKKLEDDFINELKGIEKRDFPDIKALPIGSVKRLEPQEESQKVLKDYETNQEKHHGTVFLCQKQEKSSQNSNKRFSDEVPKADAEKHVEIAASDVGTIEVDQNHNTQTISGELQNKPNFYTIEVQKQTASDVQKNLYEGIDMQMEQKQLPEDRKQGLQQSSEMKNHLHINYEIGAGMQQGIQNQVEQQNEIQVKEDCFSKFETDNVDLRDFQNSKEQIKEIVTFQTEQPYKQFNDVYTIQQNMFSHSDMKKNEKNQDQQKCYQKVDYLTRQGVITEVQRDVQLNKQQISGYDQKQRRRSPRLLQFQKADDNTAINTQFIKSDNIDESKLSYQQKSVYLPKTSKRAEVIPFTDAVDEFEEQENKQKIDTKLSVPKQPDMRISEISPHTPNRYQFGTDNRRYQSGKYTSNFKTIATLNKYVYAHQYKHQSNVGIINNKYIESLRLRGTHQNNIRNQPATLKTSVESLIII